LAGGLVAGTLDIVYACLFWALKRDALHFMIALSMSVAYYLVSRRWALLWQRPFLCGAAYGLLLYAIMNYVVVPLSAAGPGSKDPLWVTLSIAVHALLIGIPIALAVRRASQE
jgi:uncharacterized membrane protein YagU involved in acid resistance